MSPRILGFMSCAIRYQTRDRAAREFETGMKAAGHGRISDDRGRIHQIAYTESESELQLSLRRECNTKLLLRLIEGIKIKKFQVKVLYFVLI